MYNPETSLPGRRETEYSHPIKRLIKLPESSKADWLRLFVAGKGKRGGNWKTGRDGCFFKCENMNMK